MRLTNDLKTQIIHRALTDWEKGKKKLPDTKKAKEDFATYLYEYHFKKHIADLAKIPYDFLRHGSNIKFEDQEGNVYSLHMPEERPCNWRWSAPILLIINNDSPVRLLNKFKAFKAKLDVKAKHEEAKENLMLELKRVLNSATTDKKLLDVWPECEKYLVDLKVPVAHAIVPADCIEKLNTELKL